MTTKPRGPAGFADLRKAIQGKGKGASKPPKKQPKPVQTFRNNDPEAPIKLMKVSHAMTLIYIALLLAFSIVAVQNNRIRKAHSELLEAHDALYVETQVLRLEAADITSPIAIRRWAKNQGMVPYYSSEMELEQPEPLYITQQNTSQTTYQSTTTESIGQ